MVIETGDEERLFDFLHTAIGLPVAWPVAQWGTFHEGGVSLGNCNLGCNHQSDPRSSSTPTVRMVAFEPNDAAPAVIEELTRRQLTPSDAMPSGAIEWLPDVEPYAPWRSGWTNVVMLDGPRNPMPFVCAYHHDVRARVHRDEARLAAAAGGRLGITGLIAVLVHSGDVAEDTAAWQRLLGPPSPERPGAFTLAAGAELWLRSGSGPPALVLGVRSLAAAATALTQLGISYAGEDELYLDPSDALGLDLRLLEVG